MMSNIKSFYELEIKDINNKPISMEELIEKANEYIKNGYGVYIGSDSQKFFKNISLVTSVCFHHSSKGADGYYVKQKVKPKYLMNLKARMMCEMFCSLDAAYYFKNNLGCNPEVHLDIGSNPKKCKTYAFRKEFIGIVSSQGFGVKVKPESWASGVADWFTKT